MVEDISKIINKGFETYTTNLNLSIPFILNVIITGIFAILMFAIGFAYILGSSLSLLQNAASPEQVFSVLGPLLMSHLKEIVVFCILIFLILMLINSFFISGAIAMTYQATGTGKTELSTMTEAGKKNFINMFMADILVTLLTFAGIVFIVPGAMKLDLNNLFIQQNAEAGVLFFGGLLVWILYAIILSLVLVVFRYALVVDGLGPTESITTGFRFFNQHKGDVFVLWLIIGIIVAIIAFIDVVLGNIPVLNIIWPFVNLLVNVIVIPPLTTIWWVRLYLTHTDKKIYVNELLVHPNDIPKANL